MDPAKSGMDIVIVSTVNAEQEAYWQERLEKSRGQVLKNSALFIVILEDWQGGAGNGLGSLYAYQKAREKAFIEHKIDIFQKQREGYSIALYHTAGEGKRLYPLTASEFGNKSAIKLPSLIKIDDMDEPITILEAVIRQTGIYANARRGRLSVFWADQLFVPATAPEIPSRHHADLLVKLIPMPTEDEWQQKELHKYGLITLNKDGKAQHIEKSDYKTIKRLISEGTISISGGVGVSLGSFSLSTPFTFALLQEFQPELIQKNNKMDSDPYFWMPLTLDQKSYIEMFGRDRADEAKNHYLRMQYFKNHFLNKHPETNLFGIVDIGVGGFWWDLGTIDSYFNNLMKLTQNTVEGYLLRELFRLEQNHEQIILNSQIGKGKIVSSIVVGTCAEELNVEHSIIINSTFKVMRASHSLFYNVFEEEPLAFKENTVRADTYLPSKEQHIKIYAERTQDSKKLWSTHLPNNQLSYESIAQELRSESSKEGIAEFKKLRSQQPLNS
ncbi:MAG: hypothetical protein ACK4HV_00205 [Parachlamydiaceae bacterium]